MEENLVIDNTFAGSDFQPNTIVASEQTNEYFNDLLIDLTAHLNELRSIYEKLDTIESGATSDMLASEIVSKINESILTIDRDNMPEVLATLASLTSAVSTHLSASGLDKHPAANIQGVSGTYSATPTVFQSSSTRSLADELNNIRLQLHKIIGRTNWASAPSASLTTLNESVTSLGVNAIYKAVRRVTSNTTASATSDCVLECDASAGEIRVTLPSLTTAIAGTIFIIVRLNAAGGNVYTSPGLLGGNTLTTQNQVLRIIADPANNRWVRLN